MIVDVFPWPSETRVQISLAPPWYWHRSTLATYIEVEIIRKVKNKN